MGSVKPRWYGADPSWRLPFQRDGRRHYGNEITVDLRLDHLLYRHQGLEVSGRERPVPVTILFEAQPFYNTYGLSPQDYPRVFADLGLDSPHRMPDDSLCLFYPGDPPDQRWTADDGLLALFNLTADHLFFETYWRHTGGRRCGTWLAPEAPHGYQGAVR